MKNELIPLFIYREAYRNRILTLEGVRRVLKVDADKQTKLYDFFVRDVNINNNPELTEPPVVEPSSIGDEMNGSETKKEGSVQVKRQIEDGVVVKAGPGRKKKIKT
jgi:hypothetical protein